MSHEPPDRGGKGGGVVSQVCQFYLSRDEPQAGGAPVMVGTTIEPPFRSKYYGQISNLAEPQGERSKVVFPWNRMVEQVIDVLAAVGKSPWYVPCRLEEGENYLAAYAVDFPALRQLTTTQLDPNQVLQVYTLQLQAVQQELGEVVQTVAGIQHEVERSRRGQEFLLAAQRRALIAFDYQNFQKTARAGEWRIPMEQLNLTSAVQSLRWFDAEWPRKVEAVLVFDYESHHHREFYDKLRASGYRFVAVPEMKSVGGRAIQLTDQFICSEVLKYLRKPGHGIQDFILVSGDGDYLPLLQELRRRGLRVYAAGFSGHISVDLERFVNGVMVLDHLIPLPPQEYWQSLLERPPPVPPDKGEPPSP